MLVVPLITAEVDHLCKTSLDSEDVTSVLQLSNRLKTDTLRSKEMHARRSLNRNPFEEVGVEQMSRAEIEAAMQKMLAPWQEEARERESANLLQQASHGDQPHTEVQCIGPSYNVTCKFKMAVSQHTSHKESCHLRRCTTFCQFIDMEVQIRRLFYMIHHPT